MCSNAILTSNGIKVQSCTDLFPDIILTAAMTKGAPNFQSTEEGKEQADFVDYGWANIGSFDDLDRIFRYIGIFFFLLTP